jgi:hypothetical protein
MSRVDRALFCHVLHAAHEQAELVHALERELELTVARYVEAAHRGAQFLAVDGCRAEFGVLWQQLERDGPHVAVVEIREQQLEDQFGLLLGGLSFV